MPDRESLYPRDWFKKAGVDLESAGILLLEGILDTAAFHIQQAIEKYLKGYLLSKGWKLRRIHELDELLDEAVLYEPTLEKFRQLCIISTEYYIEDRYPFMAASQLNKDEIEIVLEKTKELVKKIKSLYKKKRDA